ncbi:VWA domain-containing protein [Halomicroarcula limicola]|uniref:VWA domain-containing protein n=1 Tax=Haloarcula limicola TaxID=1429915 RepID=A0A8J7YCR6_9EURY|nr:VWA domain-containing protein [Halomicroarcula limicola]MBV0926251.1 VWA domain-containing protein [Halomicroarcula limicola]
MTGIRRQLASVLWVGLLIGSSVAVGAAAISSPAAANTEGMILDVDLVDVQDADGDGNISNFNVSIEADTRISEIQGVGQGEPYFEIQIGDETRTTVVVDRKNGTFQYEFNGSGVAATAGEVSLSVALMDSEISGGATVDEFTGTVSYEPAVEDLSERQLARRGIESLVPTYNEYSGKVFNKSFWGSNSEQNIQRGIDAANPIPESSRDIAIEGLTRYAGSKAVSTWTAIQAGVWTGIAFTEWKIERLLELPNDRGEGSYREFSTQLTKLEENTEAIKQADTQHERERLITDRAELLRDFYSTEQAYKRNIQASINDDEGLDLDGAFWDFWEVNQKDYDLFVSEFSDLEKHLIADYYWTQMYLNPGGTEYTNLTTAGPGNELQNSTPKPAVIDVTHPESIRVGETAEISVEATNKGDGAPYQTIAVSFPDTESADNIRISDSGFSNPSYATVFPAGDSLNGKYGTEANITSQYPLAEVGGAWDSGVRRTFTVEATPAETGTYTFYVKTVAQDGAWHRDPSINGTDVQDQQQEYVYSYTINVSGNQTTSGGGQNAQSVVTVRQVSRPDFPEVTAYTSVKDATGDPITGLSESEFDVLEDGTDQTIQSVEPVERTGGPGVSVSLVLDRSGSMQGQKSQDSKVAANQFVDQLDTEDEAQVIAFDTNVEFKQRWTKDKGRLSTSIDSIAVRGDTALWQATTTGIEQAEPRVGRSAVIVLTDGKNNRPPQNVDRAIQRAQQAGVPVYTIGLGPDVSERNLRRLAEETGGSYYKSPSSSDLAAIYNQIRQSLVAEYKLTYETTNQATDGSTRDVEVAVDANGNRGSDTGTYEAPCAPLPTAAYDVSPTSPAAGEQVTFDGSASSPNGGQLVSYEWDFDNDGVVDATGERVTTTYANTGTYEAKLTVKKTCGATDVKVEQIDVSDASSGQESVTTQGEEIFEVISTSADETVTYQFVVEGTIAGAEADGNSDELGMDDDPWGDSVTERNGEKVVTGRTGTNEGDVFEIDGTIKSFERVKGRSGLRLELSNKDVTETLAGESATGGASSSGPGAGGESEPSTLEIVSTDEDVEFTYEITVDGTAERAETSDEVSSIGEDNDRISSNGDGTVTISGETGNLQGDAFEITGEIDSFKKMSGESGVELRLDGTDVTDQFVSEDDTGASTGSDTQSEFAIISTDQDAELRYEFRVDGEVERAELSDSVTSIDEDNDAITENGDGTTTVTGETGNGEGDAYTVTGDIISFEKTDGDSSFRLELDGEDVTDELTVVMPVDSIGVADVGPVLKVRVGDR